MANTETMKTRVLKLSSLLELQRSAMGMLAMVALVGNRLDEMVSGMHVQSYSELR
jgi:hypothetical protein